MVGAEVNGDCKTQQKSLDTISGNKIETSKILYNGAQISLYIIISAQGDVSCTKPSVWRGGGGHQEGQLWVPRDHTAVAVLSPPPPGHHPYCRRL